jgi:hypothetical protein
MLGKNVGPENTGVQVNGKRRGGTEMGMRQLNGRVFSCLLRAERGAEIAILGWGGVGERKIP